MSIRRCELVQEQRFLTEEQIEAAINGRNSINKVAYILHDKDTYTEEDEKKKISQERSSSHCLQIHYNERLCKAME